MIAGILQRFLPALQPQTSVSVSEATEKDLIEAQAGSPDVAAQLESLLRHLRTQAETPSLRVEVTNADAFIKPDKPEVRRMEVERDDEGRISGALVVDA